MKKIIAVLFIVLSFSFVSYSDTYEPTVRVALVQEMSSENLIEVRFHSSHNISLGDKIFTSISGGQTYTVGIFDEEIYVTDSYADTHFDWNSELRNEYYPLFTSEGVRLFSVSEPSLEPDIFYRDRIRGAGFYVDGELAYIITFSRITLDSIDSKYFTIGKMKFRDSFSAYVHVKNKLYPINEVGIEHYLYGVIPSEMPYTWEKEALKTQAVCARTYAYNKLTMGEPNYDLVSNTSDQMYRGMNVEKSSTNLAVDETSGMIATYNSVPIGAFFSASNGGHTSSSAEIWGSNLPYLVAKPDEFDARAGYKWTKTFTKAELKSLLHNMSVDIGEIKDVVIKSFTPDSHRVSTLNILGTNGQREYSDSHIRRRFGLKSRLFEVVGRNFRSFDVIGADGVLSSMDDSFTVLTSSGKQSLEGFNYVLTPSGLESLFTEFDENIVVLKGRGFGHGVGMSQHGANQMAKEGYLYEDILKFYYEGIELETY